MKMYEKKIEIADKWPIWFFLGAVVVCFFGNLAVSNDTTVPNDVLRDAVIEGIQANIAKLDCAVITWRSERSHFGAFADRIGQEESYQLEKGTHELWWKDEKIAADSKTDRFEYEENAKGSVVTNEVRMTYDGEIFRSKVLRSEDPEASDILIHKEPRFKRGDNYLREIEWENRGESLIRRLTPEGPTEPGTQHFSIETGDDGSRLVKYAFYNSRTGQVGFWYYDINKSYMLVRFENYASETQLAMRKDYRYEQVAGGAWFPFEINTTGFNIQNGEKVSFEKMVVDVDKSVFNEPSAIPEEVFEIKIDSNSEISDFTSGERLLYSTDVTPVAMEYLQNTMDDFLANDGGSNHDVETLQKTSLIGTDANKDIPEDSNRIGVISQVPARVNEKSILPWFLLIGGGAVCVLGVVIWTRGSKPTSDH